MYCTLYHFSTTRSQSDLEIFNKSRNVSTAHLYSGGPFWRGWPTSAKKTSKEQVSPTPEAHDRSKLQNQTRAHAKKIALTRLQLVVYFR